MKKRDNAKTQVDKIEAVEEFSNEYENGTTSSIQEAYEMLSQEDTEEKNNKN